MKETGLTGKIRSTTIAASPDDGNSQRKRRRRYLNPIWRLSGGANCWGPFVLKTLPGGWTVQSIQQPVPSPDKRGGFASGRASGHKTFAINRNAETIREYE